MGKTFMRSLMVSLMVIIGAVSFASAAVTPFARRGVSDRWVTWRVDALLHDDNRYDYREVRVKTKDKVVTLKGSVMTDYEKAHAVLVAGDIPGVKAVTDEIIVAEPVDPDIALMKRVRSEIVQDPLLKIIALDVDAKDGAVTLYGIVRDSEQKERVDELVHGIPGVKALADEILLE